MASTNDGPEIRSLRGRIGTYESWARTEDRAARTWPARKAALDRFEREVDPDGVLTQQERAKRAEWARKAHMQRLALKSATARQRRKVICQGCGGSKQPDAPMCPRCPTTGRQP